jgi:hypothetical protein
LGFNLICQAAKIATTHYFVIFETDHWWYSIEKIGVGIVLQRAKHHKNVVYKLVGIDRNPDWDHAVKQCSTGHLKYRSTHNVIGLLTSKLSLYESYNVVKANCQHFAEMIYTNLTSETTIISPQTAAGCGSKLKNDFHY